VSKRGRQYDAGDPTLIKRGKQREGTADALYVAAIHQALREPASRLVFAEWMIRAGLFDPARATETPTQMAYEEGRRSVALEMRAALERVDAPLLRQLWVEYQARQRADEQADQAALAEREETAHG
jgi:hypothetical protein